MRSFHRKVFLLTIVVICAVSSSHFVWGQEVSPTTTPDPRPSYDYFPPNMVCEEAFIGEGATIGLVTIGKTTLEEMIEAYSVYFHVQMYYREPDDEISVSLMHFSDRSIYMNIDICVIDDIIVTANDEFPSIQRIQQVQRETEMPQPPVIPTSWEYFGIKHFIARYGLPDIVTYSSDSNHRVAFWFEQGMAGEFYIVDDPTRTPSPFGLLAQVIYFPFQPVEGYENRWPFNQTVPEEIFINEAIPYVATDVSTERNPFDFEAIGATLTAQPWPMPTATTTRAS